MEKLIILDFVTGDMDIYPVEYDYEPDMEEILGSLGHRANDCQWMFCIIRLDKFPKTAEEISFANHELMHATMFIMDSCGVEYVAWSNNEAFTYLNEWLSKRAYENP